MLHSLYFMLLNIVGAIGLLLAGISISGVVYWISTGFGRDRVFAFLEFASPTLLAIGASGALGSLAFLVWAGWPGRRERAESACRVASRLCGACYYELHSIAPDPDGCTTCPECGAAWRLPAINDASVANSPN